MSKSKKQSINKQDFIDFLASATPEEINKMINEKGKPPKLIDPIVYFKSKANDKDKQ